MMGITTAKEQLMKQRIFKGKCLKQAQELGQYTVELKKDIEALECAIRIFGQIERAKK